MPPNPTILAFDTSAAHCAAALLCNGHITGRVDEMARGQAEHLMPMLEDMLKDASLSWADLGAIGVGIGPGNFTGIRISVSAARGLALGLGKPAIGVSTLEAQVHGQVGTILSCLDARRDRAYAQVFRDGKATSEPTLCDLTQADLLQLSPNEMPTVIGDVATQIADLTGWQAATPRQSLIESIVGIAASRIDETPNRPAPLYIRAADAAPSRDTPPTVIA